MGLDTIVTMAAIARLDTIAIVTTVAIADISDIVTIAANARLDTIVIVDITAVILAMDYFVSIAIAIAITVAQREICIAFS